MTATEAQLHQSERKNNVYESNSHHPCSDDPTVAAAAFGAILYSVVTGDSIVGALTNIIGRALTSRV